MIYNFILNYQIFSSDIVKLVFSTLNGIINLLFLSVNYLKKQSECYSERDVQKSIKEFLKRCSMRNRRLETSN